jgi:hypothetical protein
MTVRRWLVVLGLLGIVSAAPADVVEEKYPDGAIKLKYTTNAKGEKDGNYEEFHLNGKPKIKAAYKADKLDGSYKSWHENGKPDVTATYKAGQLAGAYAETTDQGQKKITAAYKDGKLNGVFTEYDKGKPVRTLTYKDGEVAFPRSLDDIKRKLGEILYAPTKAGGDAESEAALRKLKACRYLAEVPYDNLELDGEMAKGAQAAAAICSRLGKLDHNPPNPGLPEAEYKLAAKGAGNSNLAVGMKTLTLSVDLWVRDTDPNLGHRRACLNPALQKTGFGKAASYSAMWSSDSSQKNVPDYDYVCWPARGLMPADFFGPKDAWSVSLNPKKYKAPAETAQPKLYAVDAALNKVGEPLRLASRVNSGHCIIFRPDLSAGVLRRFLIEIDGLARLDGRSERLSYFVEFVPLR